MLKTERIKGRFITGVGTIGSMYDMNSVRAWVGDTEYRLRAGEILTMVKEFIFRMEKARKHTYLKVEKSKHPKPRKVLNPSLPTTIEVDEISASRSYVVEYQGKTYMAVFSYDETSNFDQRDLFDENDKQVDDDTAEPILLAIESELARQDKERRK